MVASEYFGMDACTGEGGGKAFRDQKIVDTPAGVLLACLETIAPPAVGIGLVGMEMAEGVYKTALEQEGHLLALLIREAGIATVGLGVLEVDFLVRHIEVATDNNRFPLVKR